MKFIFASSGFANEEPSLFRGVVFRRGRLRANCGKGDLQRAQLAPIGFDRLGRIFRVSLHSRAQD